MRLAVIGLVLAGGFIRGVHTLAGGHQVEVVALFLALTACVYGGAGPGSRQAAAPEGYYRG